MRKHYLYLSLAVFMALGLFAYPVFAQTMEKPMSGEMSTDSAGSSHFEGYKKGFTEGFNAGFQKGLTGESLQPGEVRGYQEEGDVAGSGETVRDERSDLERFYEENETTGGKWD